jgi:hypothetical protein
MDFQRLISDNTLICGIFFKKLKHTILTIPVTYKKGSERIVFKPKIPPCLEQDGIFKILTDFD